MMNNQGQGNNMQGDAAAGARRNNNGGRRENNPFFHFQNRLFHALFYRVTLTYARAFPRPIRRVLEFALLMKALSVLAILVYIHAVFAKAPMNCLEHVQEIWPRDGILRVEIARNVPENYSLIHSYKKEYSDIQLFFQSTLYEELGFEDFTGNEIEKSLEFNEKQSVQNTTSAINYRNLFLINEKNMCAVDGFIISKAVGQSNNRGINKSLLQNKNKKKHIDLSKDKSATDISGEEKRKQKMEDFVLKAEEEIFSKVLDELEDEEEIIIETKEERSIWDSFLDYLTLPRIK